MSRNTILAAAFAAAIPVEAWAQDAKNGGLIAETWCAACHVTGPESTGADAAPAFSQLSRVPDRSDGDLRAWLMDPHAGMPPLELSDAQIADLIAYIRTIAD